jgi:hypothetical protein
LSGKQLQLFKEVLPRLSRIAIFGDPGINAPQLAATETAARAVAVQAEALKFEPRTTSSAPWQLPKQRTLKPAFS